MKQIVHNPQTGVVGVSLPELTSRSGGILVRNVASLISPGTERAVIDEAEKSLAAKALERPEKLRQLVRVLRSEGFWGAWDRIEQKRSAAMSLGYSSAGVVTAVGADVTGVAVGDRVACAGGGFAAHAEEIFVPKNLFAVIPDSVTFEHAAFATISAIALQGVRLAEPTLGETFVVIGLGLVGQLAVQLLKANGCRVIGVDPAEDRVEIARRGAADAVAVLNRDDVRARALAVTRGRGVDGVLITAATPSNEPVKMAGDLCRSKGRVVVVGAVGLELPRTDYYNKELSFQISMSYGPGRYDPDYEQKGIDYPFGYVRWTEQRNLEATLSLMADGRLSPAQLISHRFAFEAAEQAYEVIDGHSPYLGILLGYPEERAATTVTVRPRTSNPKARNGVRVAFVGAGEFATRVLLPALRRNGAAVLRGIATPNALTARNVAERFQFDYCTTDEHSLLRDVDVDCVVIATRHDSHARLVADALDCGKSVFVEKPLAIDREGLQIVQDAYQRAAPSGRFIMVGFNRRFARASIEAKHFFARRAGPLTIQYRVNAGSIPLGHWTRDIKIGGGRLVGEGCHFLDFFQFVTGAHPIRIIAMPARTRGTLDEDNFILSATYADGSLGTLVYSSNGDQSLPKERIEIIGDGSALVIDNFSAVTRYAGGKSSTSRMLPDKGHIAELDAFVRAARGEPPPFEFADIVSTSIAALLGRESLQTGEVQLVPRIDTVA